MTQKGRHGDSIRSGHMVLDSVIRLRPDDKLLKGIESVTMKQQIAHCFLISIEIVQHLN
jgi:hypothetical protein